MAQNRHARMSQHDVVANSGSCCCPILILLPSFLGLLRRRKIRCARPSSSLRALQADLLMLSASVHQQNACSPEASLNYKRLFVSLYVDAGQWRYLLAPGLTGHGLLMKENLLKRIVVPRRPSYLIKQSLHECCIKDTTAGAFIILNGHSSH